MQDKYRNKMLKIVDDTVKKPLKFKASAPSKIAGTQPRAFALPAGPSFSCPGATLACKDCYATKGRHHFSNVQKAFASNWNLLLFFEKNNDLIGAVDAMNNIIPKDGIFRINESGDFHTQFSVIMWAGVIQANPKVDFYAYTRTFDIDYTPMLEYDNFTLWASTDQYNTKEAKRFVKHYKTFNVKHAYGPWDHNASLPENSFICPVTSKKLGVFGACNKCKLCIVRNRTKKNVVFLVH